MPKRRAESEPEPEQEPEPEPEPGPEPKDSRRPPGVQRSWILECSKHSDGSIYRGNDFWHRFYKVADTRETCMEAMMLSNPTNCRPHMWACQTHSAQFMMQIFSLKLSNITAAVDGPVQLYGYFAVRDHLDPLRNYIFNRTRDDPFIMGQHNGVDSDNSLIPMSGPKRGIGNQARALIEFDMKIKNGETQDDDFQLIDGAITCSEFSLPDRVFTQRIEGDSGAVDISRALLHSAVEATIQVSISQVHGSGLSLSLYSYISRIPEKLQLFDGVISKPCDLNRFVVAVVLNTYLTLVFMVDQTDGLDYVPGHYCPLVFNDYVPGYCPLVVKVGQRDGSDHVCGYCPFKARTHGYDMKDLKLGCAYILVKVSWSPLE